MQRLVIVRRNEFATFARLAQTFANEPNVRLVWDRRIRDRRQNSLPASGDRRRRDRRANPTTTWGPDDYLLLTIAQPEPSSTGGAARDTDQRSIITDDLRCDLDAAAASDLSVLISGGESVTRKTLAHRIHRQSSNGEGRFVIVEPETFAEMFARAADGSRSTGARTLAPGTLLIEEVAEWDLAQQTQLMRFLEWMTGRGAAASNDGARSTRLISGTSHWLMDRVASKQFREDLFYRLNVIHLVLPSPAPAR